MIFEHKIPKLILWNPSWGIYMYKYVSFVQDSVYGDMKTVLVLKVM